MDSLLLSDWIGLVSALAVVLSMIVTAGTLIAKGQNRASEDAELKADVKHIKELLEKTSGQVQSVEGKIDSMDIRLTRTEESCKSAHKRMDSAAQKSRNFTC